MVKRLSNKEVYDNTVVNDKYIESLINTYTKKVCPFKFSYS